MNQMESTQKKVTDMITVAENILCEGRLKEKSTSAAKRRQTKQQKKPQSSKTKQPTNPILKYIKLIAERRNCSLSIVETTRSNLFTSQQRRLILAFVMTAIVKHWERDF